RWAGGCTNVSRLYRELCTQGYAGSYSLLREALRPWREPRVPRRQGRQANLRWLCVRPRAQLSAEEQSVLDQVLAQEPAIATGYDLLQRFRALIAARDRAALATWLTDAQQSELAPL